MATQTWLIAANSADQNLVVAQQSDDSWSPYVIYLLQYSNMDKKNATYNI